MANTSELRASGKLEQRKAVTAEIFETSRCGAVQAESRTPEWSFPQRTGIRFWKCYFKENLWQIPPSWELPESSHLSEEILAAVIGWIPGVWRSHTGPHCTDGWAALLHRPWDHHTSFKGFYKISLCSQSVHCNFKNEVPGSSMAQSYGFWYLKPQ